MLNRNSQDRAVRVRGDLYERLNAARAKVFEKRGGRIPSFTELVNEVLEAYLSGKEL